MKTFNRLEYNKLCAEFLKMEKDAFILQKNIEKNTGICHLNFDSDWNLIMNVIEKIKCLKETEGQGKGTLMVTKFEITNYSVTIAFENGDRYDSISIGHTDNGKYFKHENDVDNVKQATLQAIWQFLNWYNENKKE